jgi:flagellar FliL protein
MPKSGSKRTLFIILGAVLALGGVAGFVFVKKQPATEQDEPEKKKVVVDPGVLDLDPFIVNLADSTGDRYVKLTLRLVLDQAPIAKRAAGAVQQARLRDLVLSILSKKRASQMVTLEGKDALRVELALAVETLFAQAPFFDPVNDAAPARVLEALFGEFLVQ